MRSIFNRDKNVISESRIVIAVSKYDRFLEDTSGMIQRSGWQAQHPDLKQKIRDQIEESIGDQCPPEFIVPASGRWAEYARVLKYDRNNEQFKKVVRECLSKAPDKPRGEGEDTDSESPAESLESSSGILLLEERLKQIVKNSMQCWVSALVSGYVNHLGEVRKNLEVFNTTKQQELNECQAWSSKEKKYVKAKDNFMSKAKDQTIMRRLEAEYDKTDMKKAKKVCDDELTVMMGNLESKLKEKFKGKLQLDGEALREEINKYVKHEVEHTLNGTLKNTKLDGVSGVFEKCRTSIQSDSEIVENAALKCLPEGWTPSTVDREHHIKDEEQSKASILRVGDLGAIPDITLTFWPWVWHGLKKNVFRQKLCVDWSDGINPLIKTKHDKVSKIVEKFIEKDLRQSITKSLADEYVAQVERIGKVMTDTFHADIIKKKREIEEESERCENMIAQLNGDMDEIPRQCEALNNVRHLGPVTCTPV